MNHDYANNLKNRIVISNSQDGIFIPKYEQKTGLQQYYRFIDQMVTNQNIHIFRDLSDFWEKEWYDEPYGRLTVT